MLTIWARPEVGTKWEKTKFVFPNDELKYAQAMAHYLWTKLPYQFQIRKGRKIVG